MGVGRESGPDTMILNHSSLTLRNLGRYCLQNWQRIRRVFPKSNPAKVFGFQNLLELLTMTFCIILQNCLNNLPLSLYYYARWEFSGLENG